MWSRTLLSIVLAFTGLSISNAASSISIPSDLSSAFNPDGTSLQTSYDGQSDNGFADGATFTQQQTSKAPVFALGDSSGVNTAIKFVILMIDTTDATRRVLHYMQTDFKATEQKTAINSSTLPVVAYQGPGTLGESGKREYSFLMYQQLPAFRGSDLPAKGSAFDVKAFMTANALSNALAGNIMVVNILGSGTSSRASAVASQTKTQPQVQQTQAQVQHTTSVAAVTAAISQTTATVRQPSAFIQSAFQSATNAASETKPAPSGGATTALTSSVVKATRSAVAAKASSTLAKTTAAAGSSAASSPSAASVAEPGPVLGRCGLLVVVVVAVALL